MIDPSTSGVASPDGTDEPSSEGQADKPSRWAAFFTDKFPPKARAAMVAATALSAGGLDAALSSAVTARTVVAYGTGLLGLFQAVSSGYRVHCRHWKDQWKKALRPSLYWELVWGCTAMLVISAGCFLLTGPAWETAPLAAALLLSLFLYVQVERAIYRIINDTDGLDHITVFVSKMHFGRVTTNDETLWDSVDKSGGLPVHGVLRSLLRPGTIARLSRTRYAIASGLSSLFMILLVSLIIGLLDNGLNVTDSTNVADSTSATTPATATTQPHTPSRAASSHADGGASVAPKPQHTSPPTSSAPPSSLAASLRYEQVFLSHCETEPGLGDPDPATAATLLGLWIGVPKRDPKTEAPPGFAEAGCPGQAFTPAGQNLSDFQYFVGSTSDGTQRSIATISRRLGNGMFLAPAVPAVEALIGKYDDVAGFARVDVGDGDMWGVVTPRGTAVIQRTSKTIRGTNIPTPYVTILPAAAAAWLALSQAAGLILWAKDEGTVAGIDRIALFLHPHDRRPVHWLSVKADGRVRIDHGAWVGPAGGQITEAQLRDLAKTDPPPPSLPDAPPPSGS
jgi:hypothetical protein